jgi:hypothetical protein
MLRKRISIRIEHTEVTLSITEVLNSRPDPRGSDSEPLPLDCCSACGAPWVPNLRDVLSELHLTAAQLKLAASEDRLHLFCSPDNEVWICERSVQRLGADLLSSRLSQPPTQEK